MALTVRDILAAGGLIAERLPSFEHRQEQLDMALAVETAMGKPEHLLAEAGTGVGKSFAYLVPAILRAVEHGQRAVVSTYTIALQEQLIRKDLPFLRECLGIDFKASLGKGRGNYLCIRRLGAALQHRGALLIDDGQEQLQAIYDWAQSTEDGSQQDLPFTPAMSVWEKVRSESGTCMGSKCAHREKCFVRAARQRMLEAHVLVVNHALFFADLALPEEARLLGEYSIAILDEAHTVESVASEHFGLSVSLSAAQYLLRQMYDSRNNRGLLALMEAKKAIKAADAAMDAAEDFFKTLADLPAPTVSSSGRIRQAEAVPNTLSPALTTLAGELKALRKGLDNEDQSFELWGLMQRTEEMAASVKSLLSQDRNDHAYWLEKRSFRGRLQASLSSAPIDVAPVLADKLFDQVGCIVLTSATLATARGGQHGFDYVRRRLGLQSGSEVLLASPFNYRRQAKLYVETQLGDPNDAHTFVPAACEAIRHYVDQTQGRAFVLFTSYSMLQQCQAQLEDWARDKYYNLLVQAGSASRGKMLEAFRNDGRSVLLGTASFWQGVDVAGEALSNVIITKLPFAVPDAPIIEARMDAIRAAGDDPFRTYQLPEAIIRFKQGFGRLIRTSTDKGIVVVLDHRLVTKPYGRQFIAALPDIEVVKDAFRPPARTPPATPDDLWEYT